MRSTGRWLLAVGVIMLAMGVVLPWFVGTRLSPMIYNILQLGGIGLAIIGAVMRFSGRRA